MKGEETKSFIEVYYFDTDIVQSDEYLYGFIHLMSNT